MLRSPILQVRLPSSHTPRVLLTKTWEKSPGNRGIRLQKLSYLGKLQYFTDLKLTFCQMIHDDSHTFTMIPNFFHVRSRNGPVTRISIAEPPKVTLNHVPKTPPSTNAAAPTKRHGVASPFARRSWGAVKGKERSKAKEMERNPGVAGVSEVDMFELRNLSKTRVYGKYNCSWWGLWTSL